MNRYFLFAVFFIALFFLNPVSAQQKKYTTYKVKTGETLESIAGDLHISKEQLLKLNPDLQDTVNAGATLVVPNTFFDKKNEIIDADISVVTENDIVVDGFIYHEVQPKETLYSLTKHYKVSSTVLKNQNPFLLRSGLQYGQILKIPLPKKLNKIDESLFKPYVVKPKETKFSIAQAYGISIDSLEKLNPSIKEGLKYDDVILVPAKRLADSDYNQGFDVYTVQKGETLFSLSQKFDLTYDALLAANPELKEGVQEGMLIKIPGKYLSPGELGYFRDEVPPGAVMNVDLMLPFLSNLDSLDFEKNKLVNIATDFYFGALTAIDSLKDLGLSVNVRVFDTQKSEFVTKKILERNRFDNTNVIIGPLFFNNVKAVANNLSAYPVKVVSPISEKDHAVIHNPNLIQENPTPEILETEMLNFVVKNHTDQRVVLITDNQSDVELNRILSRMKLLDSVGPLHILRPKDGYIEGNKVRQSLDTLAKNWVLLIGKDEVFFKDVIHTLGVVPDNTDLTVFAFADAPFYKEMSNQNLARIRFHYPTSVYADYTRPEFRYFAKRYRQKFHAFPSQYAIMGFDITYDVLLRSLQQTDFTTQGLSERIFDRYLFMPSKTGYAINRGIYILTYDGLDLKKLN